MNALYCTAAPLAIGGVCYETRHRLPLLDNASRLVIDHLIGVAMADAVQLLALRAVHAAKNLRTSLRLVGTGRFAERGQRDRLPDRRSRRALAPARRTGKGVGELLK